MTTTHSLELVDLVIVRLEDLISELKQKRTNQEENVRGTEAQDHPH